MNTDPHQVIITDPNPYQSEKSDLDPHLSEKRDPEPHQSDTDQQIFKFENVLWKVETLRFRFQIRNTEYNESMVPVFLESVPLYVQIRIRTLLFSLVISKMPTKNNLFYSICCL
jgi:hypothetical protein